jgi:hypothetical protein
MKLLFCVSLFSLCTLSPAICSARPASVQVGQAGTFDAPNPNKKDPHVPLAFDVPNPNKKDPHVPLAFDVPNPNKKDPRVPL